MASDPSSPLPMPTLPTNGNPFASIPPMPADSRPRSLLRDLAVELALAAGAESAEDFLADAAFLVRSSGLEHLVGDATLREVEALVAAGATLERARRAALLRDLADPSAALADYDDGASLRRQMTEAMSQSLGGEVSGG